jgi:hypothetical protein
MRDGKTNLGLDVVDGVGRLDL